MIQTTAWKVSVFGVFLIRIFSPLDWKRTRKTPNTNTFHAADLFKNSELLLLLSREKLLHPPAELFCYYKNVKKTCINHLLINFYWDLIEIYESFLLEYKSCKKVFYDGSQIALHKYFLTANQRNWQKWRKMMLNEDVLVTVD